jgi:ElaB/YqjD/DUF883 family membrane-anchored ribosome-binding protein
MTTKNKRHNKSPRKSRKMKKTRGGDNRYYNEVGDPDRDSVDERMEEKFKGIPNTTKYDNQNGWLAVGVIGVIGVILLGVTVIKRR